MHIKLMKIRQDKVPVKHEDENALIETTPCFPKAENAESVAKGEREMFG